MKIDCISDLHGEYPKLAGGDLLIIAGDITATDKMGEWGRYFSWVTKLPYTKKIMIAGNHDGLCVDRNVVECQKEYHGYSSEEFEYLCDSGTEFSGFKIWGAPWTPIFYDWYFMLPRQQLAEKWALIPEDTDILITHGPPHGILDLPSPNRAYRCGCQELALRLPALKNLKLHVFGHIHGGYGKTQREGVTFVNCALMDEDYEPTNAPIRITM